MLKKLKTFFKNLFRGLKSNNNTKKPSNVVTNDEPKVLTWREKQEGKLKDLEPLLDKPKPSSTPEPSPTPEPVRRDESMFERGPYEEHINLLMVHSFEEHDVALFMKETPHGLFIIDFIFNRLSKVMGSTSIDTTLLEGPEGLDKLIRFLEKHNGL